VAVDQIPLFLRHRWIIEVADGSYNEDVIIRSINSASTMDSDDSYSSAGNHGTLTVVGDSSTPSNVQVNSLSIFSCSGATNPDIVGLEFTGENPYVDESTSVEVAGTWGAQIVQCNFRSSVSNSGINIYTAAAKVDRCDFGSGLYGKAVRCKRQGFASTVDCTGSVTQNPYGVNQGGILNHQNDSISAPQPGYAAGGLILDNTEANVSESASLRMSADTAIPTGGRTSIPFDTVKYDDFGNWDSTNYKYVSEFGGRYRVTLTAEYLNPDAAGEVDLTVGYESTQSYLQNTKQLPNATSSEFSISVNGTVEMAAGEEIYPEIGNYTGSEQTLQSFEGSTRFHIERITP
jgi:hypothetical protein